MLLHELLLLGIQLNLDLSLLLLRLDDSLELVSLELGLLLQALFLLVLLLSSRIQKLVVDFFLEKGKEGGKRGRLIMSEPESRTD